MSDKLFTLPIDKLLKWILDEDKSGRIFGYYKELFFSPTKSDLYKISRYGNILDTPIGIAAGPQTQLSHNIILSWLFGARFIELKTVQVLDNIEVNKPCIDMYDEGYNCEWSQELRIEESFNQYLDAWIIIHLLADKFHFNPGMIFNISVGYDLEGIKSNKVKWFLDKIRNAESEIESKIKLIKPIYPQISEIDIPTEISNNVTLSTMHGCPPNEIESIAKFLIEEHGFHTTVKLNPTLLGKDRLRDILNKGLGYEIEVPDEAFEHDMKFENAISLIKNLSGFAKNKNLHFALKLSNTLESLNSASRLLKTDEKNYMSGRALHPLTVNAALLLQNVFDGKLDISFSGGADAFNVADLVACNFRPITVCSDLLKPGGYSRLPQYLEKLSDELKIMSSNSIEEFVIQKGKSNNIETAGLNYLTQYAEETINSERYKKSFVKNNNIKTTRVLDNFDCVFAPCIQTCAISQDVPNYLFETDNDNIHKAYQTILEGNPLPNITGMVCDHLCQTKCTRINMDNSLLIREIKRFVSNSEINSEIRNQNILIDKKVAVIGAGPSGLSIAYFLALKGIAVDVFESHKNAGGMAASAIPKFRIDKNALEKDIENIKSMGVNFSFNYKIDEKEFNNIYKKYDFVYIGVGAQKGKELGIEGENLNGVFDQITFLEKVKSEEQINLGKDIAIIGGGNSAIDAARTAKRLVSNQNGNVILIYRRTQSEMPADKEEILELLEEDISILELTAPVRISQLNSKLILTCQKMELGESDLSGRKRPIAIKDSEFNLEFDSIITAVGQDVELDFLPINKLKTNSETKETEIPNIYAGGDAVRGADSLINAVADGKIAASSIFTKIQSEQNLNTKKKSKTNLRDYQIKLSKRVYGFRPNSVSTTERNNFDLVNSVLDKKTAIEEASRCLYCDEICNICVSVCPNLANYYFETVPFKMVYENIEIDNNEFKVIGGGTFTVNQKYQIINLNDFCNECGNCETFCPTSGAPYKVKARFSLSKKCFASEKNGFMIERNTIYCKRNGNNLKLFVKNEITNYEDDYVLITFNSDFIPITINQKVNEKITLDMNTILEMYFYLDRLKETSLFTTN